MLISMPTGTSRIFGVFQVIRVSQVVGATSRNVEPKATPDVTQVRKIEGRTRGATPEPILLS